MARGKRVKKNPNAPIMVGIAIVATLVLVIAAVGVYQVFFKTPAAPAEDPAPAGQTDAVPADTDTPPENGAQPQAEKTYAVPAAVTLPDGTELALGASGELTEKALASAVSAAAKSFNTPAVAGTEVEGEGGITVTRGVPGAALDEEATVENLKNGVGEAVVSETAPEEIDFEELLRLYAAVETETGNGRTFDLQAAKAAYAALGYGESMEIPFIEIRNGWSDADFPDVLCERSTSMKSSSANRINNITLAAEAIDGTVLMPGDRFSYNDTVGQRTEAKGYKPAGAYVGGETVDEIGGGICQVSSTLYWCALKSDLRIVKRSNHMYPVAYLPLGFDATVNWGTIDFQFENSLQNPVRITAYVENKELFIKIEGTKEGENTIELRYATIETVPWTTEYRVDESLEAGKTKTKQEGQAGYVVDTFKVYKDADGNKLEEVKLGRSKYRAHTNIILCAPDAYERIMAEKNGTPLPEEPENNEPENNEPENNEPEDVPEDEIPEDEIPEDEIPEDEIPEDEVPEDGKPEDEKPEEPEERLPATDATLTPVG